MQLTLAKKFSVSPGVERFEFNVPEGFVWQPGQYMKVTLPHDNPDDRGTERWFTISAAPFTGVAAITTRMDGNPRSSFKDALEKLEVGSTLQADTPEGDFVMAGDGPCLLVAGGIGVTPYYAMLLQADHDNAVPPVHLLYAGRTPELPWKAEFEALAAKYPQLSIEYVIEPEQLSPELILQKAGSDKDVYVSGPEPMVEAFEAKLAELGLPKGRLHNDYFPGYAGV